MAAGLSLAGVAGILPEADAIGTFLGPPGWIAAGALTLGTAAVATAPEWAPTAGKILSQTGRDLYKAGHWFASTLENALGGTSHAAESEQSKKQGETEVQKVNAPGHTRRSKEYEKWRVLPNGRIRYYDKFKESRVEGKTKGRRHVTEVDAKTGKAIRGWEECYDSKGRVVQVHPKQPNDLGHLRIDPETGKVIGRSP